MIKITIDVEIPDYEIKYCDDVNNGNCCPFLQKYNYGFKQYCILSKKDITNTTDNGDEYIDRMDADAWLKNQKCIQIIL